MKLTILTTLYKTGSYLEDFYHRAVAAATIQTDEFEIIFVDDGSPDDALEIACNIQQSDCRVRIIELSRNFGHHKAIFTGLEHCDGDFIYLLDSDLEEDPEWLALFLPPCLNQGTDCAIGVQKTRAGNIRKRFEGRLFYWILNWLSDTNIPADVTVARVMSKQYVRSLLLHKETELFFSGICALTGYNQCFIEVDKQNKGTSSYKFSTKLRQAVNAVTSFSNKPLYIVFVLGLSISILCGVASIWILLQKIFFTVEHGYALLIISIWGGVGALLTSMGILGVYIAKIYVEVKQRPTIIKKVHKAFNESVD